jgi:rRNA maturation protein Nop10
MYKCEIHGYCLTKICPVCKKSAKTVETRFSPDDKYGRYRREEKWKNGN